jgi:four helix bundle protein
MADRPHKKLEAWKRSIELTKKIYQLTDNLPSSEDFGLKSQMRRAAVSISSNIAEGAAKQTKKEFIHFLYTAQGSLSELDTQLTICHELKYLSDENIEDINSYTDLEGRLINGLINYLKR